MVKLWSRKQIVKTCTVCVKAYNTYDIQKFVYSGVQMLKKNSLLNSWGNIIRTLFSRFYYIHHHGVQAHFYDIWAVNNPPLVAEVGCIYLELIHVRGEGKEVGYHTEI